MAPNKIIHVQSVNESTMKILKIQTPQKIVVIRAYP